MRGPLVQVIIPTFNREHLIRETLDSVLAQTYYDFVILISDDGSTDDTVHVLRQYQENYRDKIIRILRSPTNQGTARNFNKLLDVIVPEGYVAFLDSDDLWMPRKLEIQVALMEEHPEWYFSFHDVEFFDSDSSDTLGLVSELVGRGRGRLRGGGIADLFDPRLGMSQSSTMYRANVLRTIRRNVLLRVDNDFLFDVEALANGGSFGAINQILGKYRRHSGNISRQSRSTDESFEEMLLALAIIEARYPCLYFASLVTRRHIYTVAVIRSVRKRDYRRGKAIARNSLRSGAGVKPLLIYFLYRFFDRYSQRLKAHPFVSKVLSKAIYRL